MRYEDASHTAFQGNEPIARDDSDALPAGSRGPATGNLISGQGTQTGSAGADQAVGAHITSIAGKGGEDSSFAGGQLSVTGEYGKLSVDADGNYSYMANAGSPENVRDRFSYTLADSAGNSDSALLLIELGKTPAVIKANAQQIVPGPDGVVTLPPGVSLADVHVVGRNLVIDLPDGTQLVIVDGAVFVPQLVLDGVEVPATNLAALLIGQEPQPAAGDGPVQSSGGNFDVPVPPLDPGVPLGDLIPPTEYQYTPPDVEEIGDVLDEDVEAGAANAVLDDDAQAGGIAGGVGDGPGEDTASGFLPASGGDGDLEWSLLASGELPSGLGLSFAAQPNGDVWLMQNGVHVITISVDSSTGEYTVEQLQALDHAPLGDENNIIFTINYMVTDQDGDTAVGTLTVDVDDDTPTASVTAGPDANVVLTTDDADTIGDNSDDDSTSADFSGVFTGTSVSPGADGAGSGTTDEYSLNVTAQNSGLRSHGSIINLFMVGDTVVGTTAGSAPASLADPSIVFTVAVDALGVVTLTQMQQIDHADEAPGATDAPFNDQFASLADGLVTLTRAVHLVDGDGDPVDASATVNIGANLHFTDDGPTIEGARAGSSVELDETDGAEPVSSGAPIIVTSDDPMIVPLGVDYGADGQGPDPVYGLSLLGGVDSIDSGLATADGDHPITLVLVDSDTIEGRYEDSGTQVAFIIEMNDDGTVTVTLNTALEHLDDGPPGPAHDDTLNLTMIVDEQEVSLVNATVTVEDFDGDTASAEAPIGNAITFRDDGPSVTINAEGEADIELITDDDGTEGDGSTSDSTSANFGGVFSLGASSGGGDGTASTSLLSFQLGISDPGADSGLTSNGDAINLYMVGDTVVGAIGAQPADLNDADIVFTVSVDGDGVVTLTQLQQIDHPAVDDPSGTGAEFDDHTISMLDDSLITLTASATITDNDGDTASDEATINIAANLVFRDDGPTIDATLEEGASVHVDESLPGVDGAPDETDAVGLGQVTVALSSIVSVVEDPESADQPTTLDYALVLGPAVGGLVDSGMMTSDGNLPVYLYLQPDGSVIGSTATDAGDVDGSNTVFTVEIVGGNVVLTQFQAIEHPNPGPPGPAHDENTLGLADGALLLQVTGTDFDGDTDSDTVDLGSVITFGDDGPSVEVVVDQLPTDPEALAAFQLTTQDDGTEGAGDTEDSTTADFSGLFSLNKDGGSDGEAASSLTYDLDLLGAGNGPVDSGLDSHGQTIWLHQIDANTIIGSTSNSGPFNAGNTVFQLSTTNNGIVTLTQFQQIDHIGGDPTPTGGPPFADHVAVLGGGLIELVATGSITDNDGDIDTDTERLDMGGLVRFQDDGPTIDATLAEGASVHVDESDPGTDGPGETDNPGLGQVTVALSAIVDVEENPQSADQPTTLAYELALGPDEGGLVDSGLTTSDGDLPIYLFEQPDGSVIGSTALDAGDVDASNTVFTVAIVGGNVVLTQFQAIEHPNPGPPGPAHDENTLGLADGALLLQVTGTDFDGDTDSDTVDLGSVITFGDDGPVCTDEAQQSVAENAPNVLGTFDFDGGSDGASVTHINGIVLVFGGDEWSQWIPVDDGQIRAQADGSYEFDPDGSGSGVTSGTFTVTDNDGDTDVCDWSFNITDANSPSAGSSNALLDDDGLVVPADPVLDGDGDINANTGEVAAVDPSEAVFHGDLNASFGGDGAGSINFAAMVGQFRMVGTERVEFTWNAGTLTLTAIVAAEDGVGNDQDRAGTELFEVVLDPSFNGNYTLTLLDNVLHAAGGDDETSAPNVSLTFNIIDSDNSPAGGVPGTLIVTFNDDTPVAEVDGQVEVPTLTLDESPEADPEVDEGGDFDPAGLASLTVGFADNFQAADYGADGAGTTTYALVLEADGSGSGMYALDNTDTDDGGDLDGYGQGAEIQLFDNNGVIEGRVGTDVYFTISVNAAGEVTFTQLMNVWHSDPTNDDDTSWLSAAAEVLQLEQTVTDADGDSDSALIDLSDGVFAIEDDGPEIITVTDATGANTGSNPSAEGDFVFDVGTDSPNGGHDDIFIDPDTFVVSINGTPLDVTDVNFGEALAGEDEHTAEYAFDFTYATGPGTTDTVNGTLIFYKDDSVVGHAAGTYEVVLDGTVQGFTLAQTGNAGVDDFHAFDAPGQAGGSPEIQNVQIADNLFIQFTSGSVGQNGTFQTVDFPSIDPDPAAEVPPDPNLQWVEGDIFTDNNSTLGTVTASSAAIGANSNTLQNEEVIEFNLYASDPGGTPNADPTTHAGEMFVKFDLISNVDDLVVVLKLMDTVTGEFTTKTIIVDAADLYRGNSAADEAFLATTIYSEFSNMGNNEALLIIQPNDYNGVGEHWEIVGGQILVHPTDVTGTGINLNRGLGSTGGSSVSQAFTTDGDDGSAKIMSIGFLVPDTTDQSVTIDFEATITDADGDTETTPISVQIGDPPADTLAATSFSSQDEQVQKSAANSNTLTMAAAVAAAGMAESAAAAPADDQSASLPSDSESGQSTQEVSTLVVDDGADDSSSVAALPETQEAEEASSNSGGHGNGNAYGHDNQLDDSSSHQAANDQSADEAANDQGPASAADAQVAVAPAVMMVSAEALKVADLDDKGHQGDHGEKVEQVVAEALGHGAAPTVDALLAGLPNGEVGALHALASPAFDNAPAWDMGAHGGFANAADMIMKVGADMAHHDAVQPVVNG